MRRVDVIKEETARPSQHANDAQLSWRVKAMELVRKHLLIHTDSEGECDQLRLGGNCVLVSLTSSRVLRKWTASL